VLFSLKRGLSVTAVGDVVCCAAPIGLFFGRIANFINGEVYGRLTDMPWGVEFPPRVLDLDHAFGPRHPTQIYEACLEGILLFLLIRYFTHYRRSLTRPGLTAGLFLAGYAVARIGVEFFKEWDYQQFFTTTAFSEGMVYSLPMLICGIFLMARAGRRDAVAA
jgi:phosphatidylglycerol:prolipoprotein diacylglycerol transferase